jgi:ELWxxDGT repeat protein
MNTSGSSSYVNSSYPDNFIVYNDKLFFNAQNTTIGSELFYYDGTDVTGIDIYTGSITSGDNTYLNSSYPYSITEYNSVLTSLHRTALMGLNYGDMMRLMAHGSSKIFLLVRIHRVRQLIRILVIPVI